MIDRLFDVASRAGFAFGALTFSTLAVFYWFQRGRGNRTRHTVLPVFTLVCAIAFLSNLLSESAFPRSPEPWLGLLLLVAGGLAPGLLPPLIFHLVVETDRDSPARSARWRRVVVVFYFASMAAVSAQLLQEAGLRPGWTSLLDRVPAISLAAASTLSLLFLAASKRPGHAAGVSELRWIRGLMILMLVCALASLGSPRVYVDQFADYLLLAFFCVCLYYRERLIFFDVLMKRGVFLALGLAALTFAVVAATWPQVALPDGASLWLCGFLLCWLAAPIVHAGVARSIDHVWLLRPYSAVEAERQFARDLQATAAEEELHASATKCLAAIFQTPAEVRLGCAPVPAGQNDGYLSAEIRYAAVGQGFILLPPRPNGVPFLSDDRRLLHVLAGTLAMALENLRFRADRRRQEEREQQLRLLASRAELKALRAQINPHFLFNALSVIGGLAQYQPELASETVERLAQVFRYTLRKSDDEWTPLGEEVEFIAAYLRIEQARFGDRLQVEFDVDPASEQIPIPAMSIQPLIENAIRHGVSAREERGIVGLHVALWDGRLSIEVFDNGPGFPPGFSVQAPGEGHGLRNVAERLRGYFGDSATLSWKSGADGTRVILTLPRSLVSCETAGERD
ncbi:MAG TPA: histidine kinase [Bryobacteraceae bacterium]|nr:histidine kinase [Bryobacteraceae bacterium]